MTGPYALRGILGVLAIVAAGIVLSSFGAQARVRSDAADTAGRLNSTALLSGSHHRITSTAFRGGEATAFMGGIKLDLREAQIEGDEAIIDLFAMMGGVEVIVPETWTVESKITQVMGGVENKARQPAEGDRKRLILRGTVVMGGLTIRN